MRQGLFESILDNVTDGGQKTASAEIAAGTNNDEWFGRDEDWSMFFEYRSFVSLFLLDGVTEEQIILLWEKMMELFRGMFFTNHEFTLIFDFQWNDAQFKTCNYQIETVETTTLEKFRQRLIPLQDILDEFVDDDIVLWLTVELKFENESNIRFKKFSREMNFIYKLLIENYRKNDSLEAVQVEFVQNRANDYRSDHFCTTDLGGSFTDRQKKEAYERIFGKK